MSPRAARVGLAVYVSITLVSAGLLIALTAAKPAAFGPTLVWLLACLAGEAFWITTPTQRGTLSMALGVDLAAVFALGAATALPIVAVSTFAAGIYPHRRGWQRALFNAAQTALSAGVAAWILTSVEIDANGGHQLRNVHSLVMLFVAGAGFFLTNTLLVTGAIRLQSGGRFWRIWIDDFAYYFELASSLAQTSLAGFLLMAYQQMGPVAILALLPILAVLWWSSGREADVRADEMEGEGDPKSDRETLRKAG